MVGAFLSVLMVHDIVHINVFLQRCVIQFNTSVEIDNIYDQKAVFDLSSNQLSHNYTVQSVHFAVKSLVVNEFEFVKVN